MPFAQASWESLLNSVGFPVFCVIIMGMAILYASRVVWRDIVIPIRDRLLARINAFFDRLDVTLTRSEQRSLLDSATLVRHEDILWRIEGIVEEMTDKCDRILSRTAGLPDPPSRPPRNPRPRPQPPKEPAGPQSPASS